MLTSLAPTLPSHELFKCFAAYARRRIQQQIVEIYQDAVLSPSQDYGYKGYEDDGYEYDPDEDNDDTENLPVLKSGEIDYEETCFSAPDVVASINNSEYSLSMFHDALYTTGIVGENLALD